MPEVSAMKRRWFLSVISTALALFLVFRLDGESTAPGNRSLSVCEVLDGLDALNGKTISIIGYLDGSTLEGLILTNGHTLRPCTRRGLPWFRWPSALAISLIPTVPLAMRDLLNSKGFASGARVKVKAKVEAKSWRYIFCVNGSECISNGYIGRFSGSLKLLEISALPEH